MRISDYYLQYTDHKNFGLGYMFEEVLECFREFIFFRWHNIPDELSDISIFIELWLYTHFKYDHELWKSSHRNLKKVASRRPVWDRIYRLAGIIVNSHYCGNYSKVDKVITHLAEFGVSEMKAREVYHTLFEK